MGQFILSLDETDRKHILRCVERVIAVLPPTEYEQPTGGYFTIYRQLESDYTSFRMISCLIGTVPAKKEEKYRIYSVEKALRLSFHDEHRSSFQSRDEANGKWPGAIRTDDGETILSFSGLPWKADEAAMLMYAVESKQLMESKANQIAQISQNEIYFKLIEAEAGI